MAMAPLRYDVGGRLARGSRAAVSGVRRGARVRLPRPRFERPPLLHLTGHLGDELVAVMRVVPPGVSYDECSIGRVVVPTALRGQKRGVQLMEVGINFCESRWDNGIRISGQAYLKGFYEALGFKTVQGPYMEDDIPHFEMLKPGS